MRIERFRFRSVNIVVCIRLDQCQLYNVCFLGENYIQSERLSDTFLFLKQRAN